MEQPKTLDDLGVAGKLEHLEIARSVFPRTSGGTAPLPPLSRMASSRTPFCFYRVTGEPSATLAASQARYFAFPAASDRATNSGVS